ncbi:pilin [Pseudoalteromonas sp. MQS005]|uniref:pilin n=1 Tax=Pseudoalteromonas sp. MQS005 TaxID=1854052 RepID=UPI000A8C8B76|nr:pilin [Pseudoalteromonas sp. MQS005]
MQTMTQQNQKGFTLIELMIVVAIIGILAAVALPQYQNYTARAQASEAVSLAAGAKTAISEFYQSNGSYPGASTAPKNTDLSVTGTYASTAVTAGTGVIVATMNSAGVSSKLQGKKFTFTPDLTNNGFKWTCTNDLAAGDESIAPKGCAGATK